MCGWARSALPAVEFPWSYPYRYDASGTPAPIVPVRLQIGHYQVDVLMLVDTGAERTLLEGVHARAAGLDIFDGKSVTFQGFLGARTVAYLHKARLVIGETELEADIAFSTQPLARQILGRDVLAHFALCMRERASEFYLAPEL